MPEQAARASAPRSARTRPRRERNSSQVEGPWAVQDSVRAIDARKRAVRELTASSASDHGVVTPRMTVVIRGQVVDRQSAAPRASGSLGGPSYGRIRMRPERAALWAVLLGFALVLAALASAHM